MAGRSGDQIADLEAERLIKELAINSLPVDPIAIADSLWDPGPATGNKRRCFRNADPSGQRVWYRFRHAYR